jgi:hypothetical protein
MVVSSPALMKQQEINVNTATAFDAIAFARTSATIAIDQAASARKGESVADYRDNVIDTCHEHGVDDTADALAMFDKVIDELLPRAARITDSMTHAMVASAFNRAAAKIVELRGRYPSGMSPAIAAKLPRSVQIGWLEAYIDRYHDRDSLHSIVQIQTAIDQLRGA